VPEKSTEPPALVTNRAAAPLPLLLNWTVPPLFVVICAVPASLLLVN
jgi:hypothetical protein